MSQGKRLVIKFNSQAHQWRDEIFAALPGAHFLFLHREPAAVLESIARKPPQYLQREAAQHRFAARSEIDRLQEDPLLKAAALRYWGALDAFQEAPSSCLVVAYRELKSRFAEISEHFRLGHGTWDATRNAKAGDPSLGERYKPVADANVARIIEQHSDLHGMLDDRYRQFVDRQQAKVSPTR